MENFFDYSTDVFQHVILPQITDVDQIINLSQVSTEMQSLLKKSITTLTTMREIVYLDADWLIDYPSLTFVDDKIIFIMNDSINIPNNLKKLTIKLRDASLIIPILKSLKHPIKDYTFRFIYPSSMYDALIIDRGFYSILHQFNQKRDYIITNVETLDKPVESLLRLAGVNLNLDLDIVDENALNKYYFDHKFNEKFLSNISYPSPRFREFIEDVSKYIDITDLLSAYFKTGYILEGNKNTAGNILSIYSLTKDLEVSKKLMPRKYTYYPDDILLKYQKELNVTVGAKFLYRSTSSKKNTQFMNHRDLIVSHLYLDNPSVYDDLLDDYSNIVYMVYDVFDYHWKAAEFH